MRIVFYAVAACLLIASLTMPPWFQIDSNGTGDHIQQFHFCGFAPWSAKIAPTISAQSDAGLTTSKTEPNIPLTIAEASLIGLLAALYSIKQKKDAASAEASSLAAAAAQPLQLREDHPN